ncbi:hypothetical protein QCA50_010396 [Cerrena zonata]|uniref:SnoaL-like domain-containing protein n=1 Tax=Cerrena zonata TaxID=2478898 RepID=A0AAW0FXI7_9APHY
MPLAPSDAIPANPSPQLQVVLTWMRALSSANPDAAELLATTLTEDHTYHFLPRSLGYPSRNKEQFLAYARKVPLSLFRNPQLHLHQVIEAPGKITIQATTIATFHTGARYENEYMTLYHLIEQEGEWKIQKVEEFVDARAMAYFFPSTAPLKIGGQDIPRSNL